MSDFLNAPASILSQLDVSLGELAIKSSVPIALTWLACAFLRKHSAAIRHRIWVFGVVASLLVPVAVLVMPHYALQILPDSRADRNSSFVIEDQQATHTANYSGPALPAGSLLDSDTIPTDGKAGSNRAGLLNTTQATPNSASGDSLHLEPILTLCWVIGICLAATLFLIGLLRQNIRLRSLPRIEDAEWCRSVEQAAQSVGLKRKIVTLETEEQCVPAVVGIFQPQLVIPADWRNWSRTQRDCILLHELAHVKRYDVSTQLLGRLALIAYWFNPLFWYAAKQLRVERELAADDSVLRTGRSASDYAEQLLRTLRRYRPRPVVLGVSMAHSARLDERVRAILDPIRRRDPVGLRFAILLPCLVGVVCFLLGGVTLSSQDASAAPPEEQLAPQPAAKPIPVWKENYTVEFPGTLPVSVQFSADGKKLLTGDTSGEIMSLIFKNDEPLWEWKSKVAGSHPAVAYSADQKLIYATTTDGVQILDADQGKEQGLLEEKNSNPIAIGVFPDKTIAEQFTRSQIVFGNSQGYFVKSWVQDKLPDTVGTIETSTVAKEKTPADNAAVPLAVDPQGRSAIMTGPIDTSGEISGTKGANVLWAYVCGDYDEGSPGNRVMVGHSATVVSAAWAKTGDIAVTGDAEGRVILWDTKTMEETGRFELNGRVAALTLSADGSRCAAYVIGKHHGQIFVWETEDSQLAPRPIHAHGGDFSGSDIHASLSFSPDGKWLAGCAMNKLWLNRLGELVGKVRVWEIADEPQAQLPPKKIYSKTLPKESSSNFVILHNHSLLMPASKEGAVDFRSIRDGGIQLRMTLGEFLIGGITLSDDRRWLAIKQHEPTNNLGIGLPSRTFDVGIYSSSMQHRATIPECRQTLDIASGGEVIAIVRENSIEVCEVETAKTLKTAPFEFLEIHASKFSPDGKLLAIIDQNDLVLWDWEEGEHERIRLRRRVGSLAFSPDGKFLAEGPNPRKTIQIRDLKTRKVVQELSNGSNLSMAVPRMAFAQSGRVLIACDNITYNKEIVVPYRINLWDMATGEIAHQIELPNGLPDNLAVTPNGRHLVAMLDDGKAGKILSTWRLDGEIPQIQPGTNAPAATESD